MESLQKQIDDLVEMRLKLFTSDVLLLKRRMRQNHYCSRRKIRKTVRAFDGEVYEVRRIKKNFGGLARKRYNLYKSQVVFGVKLFTEKLEQEVLRVERSNLHNFTELKLDSIFDLILGNNGGCVTNGSSFKSSVQIANQFKNHAETALLKYV